MNCPYATVEPTIPPNCENNHPSCNYWAGIGECEANPGYMLKKCKKSCQVCGSASTTITTTTAETPNCKDDNTNCQYWASVGECNANPNYMLVKCKKSCEACDPPTTNTTTTIRTTGMSNIDFIQSIQVYQILIFILIAY